MATSWMLESVAVRNRPESDFNVLAGSLILESSAVRHGPESGFDIFGPRTAFKIFTISHLLVSTISVPLSAFMLFAASHLLSSTASAGPGPGARSTIAQPRKFRRQSPQGCLLEAASVQEIYSK